MRRLFQILSAVCVFFSAAACQRETDTQKEKDVKMVHKFTASIDNSADTKTYLDGYKVCWNKGDEISINGDPFTATPDDTDNTKAEFEGSTEETGDYTAIYPRSIYQEGQFVLPDAYNVQDQADNFSCVPMWAYSNMKTLEFKNIFAVLKVSVSENVSVSKIEITTGNYINGQFSVLEDEGGTNYASIESTAETNKTTTLNCAGDEVRNFFIPIPQGTYASGTFSVTVTDSNGECETKTNTKGDITLAAGKIFSISFDKSEDVEVPVLDDPTINEIL